jgi:hypothetical protein
MLFIFIKNGRNNAHHRFFRLTNPTLSSPSNRAGKAAKLEEAPYHTRQSRKFCKPLGEPVPETSEFPDLVLLDLPPLFRDRHQPSMPFVTLVLPQSH